MSIKQTREREPNANATRILRPPEPSEPSEPSEPAVSPAAPPPSAEPIQEVTEL